MTFLTSRTVVLLIVLKVILISILLVHLRVFPNPLEFIIGSETSWNLEACTMEARLCPDGSYVGRVGPSCDFALCSDVNTRVIEIEPEINDENRDTVTPSVPPEGNGGETSGDADSKQIPSPIACTMDAKQCPDGSYVGRTGPRCEFEECPTSNPSLTLTVSGTVSIGPTCPVERDPPDPNCSPAPYNGTILLINTSTGKNYPATTDTAGMFSVTLTRGVYDISRPQGISPFPVCSGKVEITNANLPLNIMCDSGIR